MGAGAAKNEAMVERAAVARAAPRLKVFRPAWLQTADGRYRAHVLNLSPIGACLHARCRHRVWSAVTLQLGERTVEARVTWFDGERCGVKFASPLSADEMAV